MILKSGYGNPTSNLYHLLRFNSVSLPYFSLNLGDQTLLAQHDASETKSEAGGPICEGPCSFSRSCRSAEGADSQHAVSLVARGDAHAGKVGLLQGFKQNPQSFRSGERCDEESSADGDSGDVDAASDDGDVVALTPQEAERTKKKQSRFRPRGAWNTPNDLVLCEIGEHVFRVDVK